MSIKHTCSSLLLTAILFISAGNIQAQNIEIVFTSLASAHGQIIVKVFTDEKGFQDDKAFKTIKFNKNELKNGQMTGKLTLDPGIYGFALLDDENNNGVMDYNLIRMPKEGFGFSNFYLDGMKKPKFEQFKFTLNRNQPVRINMKVRYL